MIVTRIELVDYRNYASPAAFDLTPGITAVVGRNGQGKTNFARGRWPSPRSTAFRVHRRGAHPGRRRCGGHPEPPVRHDDGRELSIEAELSRSGRNRVLVNRQKLPRTRDLLGVVRVSVFSPDDLALVKEGPSERRRFLDDTLVALALRRDAARTRPGREAAEHLAQAGCGPTRRGIRRRRSTCGTRSTPSSATGSVRPGPS
ncbi:MAG: hypothetical protein R2713_12735 [Ilumatobacteraceae bacterium]